jgi:hypothetical protein
MHVNVHPGFLTREEKKAILTVIENRRAHFVNAQDYRRSSSSTNSLNDLARGIARVANGSVDFETDVQLAFLLGRHWDGRLLGRYGFPNVVNQLETFVEWKILNIRRHRLLLGDRLDRLYG